jgi:hypothetical protein
MVGWLGRRTEPRVGFSRDVRVIWSGEMNGVVARAVNLSPAGILVDAPTPTTCPVGSPVLCDVALPSGALRIRGRVAHRRDLSPAKVGMGIAFVDLSPWVAAELCKVIDESEEKAQPVKLRFAGTSQILCTRALPTAEGFRFTTALPFLRSQTEVDITLSPDAAVGTKGWVSAVSLDRGQHGVPHLVIDIRAVEGAPERTVVDAQIPGGAEVAAEPELELAPEAGALPDRLWEVGDLNETQPGFQRTTSEESAPSDVAAAAVSTALAEPWPADQGPWDPDQTENVRIRDLLPRRKRLPAGAVAGAACVLAVVTLATALRVSSSRASKAAPVSTPLTVALKSPPPSEAPAGAASQPAATPASTIQPMVEPTVAPTIVPILATSPAAAEASSFKVGLVGSLAGAQRYPLRTPDGVAFNLPKAQATMAHGTYNPAIRGLRAVWVRALPGGGTHLRFYYTKSRPSPDIVLQRDGVRVRDHAASPG